MEPPRTEVDSPTSTNDRTHPSKTHIGRKSIVILRSRRLPAGPKDLNRSLLQPNRRGTSLLCVPVRTLCLCARFSPSPSPHLSLSSHPQPLPSPSIVILRPGAFQPGRSKIPTRVGKDLNSSPGTMLAFDSRCFLLTVFPPAPVYWNRAMDLRPASVLRWLFDPEHGARDRLLPRWLFPALSA